MCVLNVFPNKQYYIIGHVTWYVPYVTLSIHGTLHISKCLDTNTTIFRNVDTELGVLKEPPIENSVYLVMVLSSPLLMFFLMFVYVYN